MVDTLGLDSEVDSIAEGSVVLVGDAETGVGDVGLALVLTGFVEDELVVVLDDPRSYSGWQPLVQGMKKKRFAHLLYLILRDQY